MSGEKRTEPAPAEISIADGEHMQDNETSPHRRLPSLGLPIPPFVIGIAVFLLVWVAVRQLVLGMELGAVAAVITYLIIRNQRARQALDLAEAELNDGDTAKAAALLNYARTRLQGNRGLILKYRELQSALGANQASPVLETTGAETSSITATPVEPPAMLSWPAVLILCLAPFTLLPYVRLTFPYFGLWAAVAVLATSLYLLKRDDKKLLDSAIAWSGMALSLFAFFATYVAHLSSHIPGGFALDRLPFSGDNSWPARIAGYLILAVSIILHECAHGAAAYCSGDRTAKDAGRITLNPMRHVDPIGSILLPIILSLAPGGVVFGWAKPVPVNPESYRHPRHGRLAVSLAGVGTNLFLAVFCSSLLATLGILLHLGYPSMTSMGFALTGQTVILTGLPMPAVWQFVVELLKAGILINLVLFLLNILPVPPLDGFGIIEGLMPAGIRQKLSKARGFGAALFLFLIFTKVINTLLLPALYGAFFLNLIAGLLAKLG